MERRGEERRGEERRGEERGEERRAHLSHLCLVFIKKQQMVLTGALPFDHITEIFGPLPSIERISPGLQTHRGLCVCVCVCVCVFVCTRTHACARRDGGEVGEGR